LPGTRSERSGEAAKVRRPQNGGQLDASPAADLAGEDLGPGSLAQIGAQHVAGDPPLAVKVDDDRQSLPHPRQIVDLVRREAAEPVGYKRDHVIDGTRAGYRGGHTIYRNARPIAKRTPLLVSFCPSSSSALFVSSNVIMTVYFSSRVRRSIWGFGAVHRAALL
jgi:hypothetical protein